MLRGTLMGSTLMLMGGAGARSRSSRLVCRVGLLQTDPQERTLVSSVRAPPHTSTHTQVKPSGARAGRVEREISISCIICTHTAHNLSHAHLFSSSLTPADGLRSQREVSSIEGAEKLHLVLRRCRAGGCLWLPFRFHCWP